MSSEDCSGQIIASDDGYTIPQPGCKKLSLRQRLRNQRVSELALEKSLEKLALEKLGTIISRKALKSSSGKQPFPERTYLLLLYPSISVTKSF